MITNRTISGVQVDYTNYIWVHGRAPKGNGRWAYFLENEKEPRFYEGTFTETRKLAVKDAKTAGARRIQVGSWFRAMKSPAPRSAKQGWSQSPT